MKYLALIYCNEQEQQARGEAWMAALFDEYRAYGGWLEQHYPGKVLGGEPLRPVATATTIRVRDGKRTLTDGPFAETKEQLAGFYMFDAKDLDEAIAMASKIPDAKYGSVEVRPVLPLDM